MAPVGNAVAGGALLRARQQDGAQRTLSDGLLHCSFAQVTGRTGANRNREGDLLDHDEIEARAREVRPALLIAGGSAYARTRGELSVVKQF